MRLPQNGKAKVKVGTVAFRKSESGRVKLDPMNALSAKLRPAAKLSPVCRMPELGSPSSRPWAAVSDVVMPSRVVL